jgi:diguanylate cyclase with GGDEF domain
MPMNGRAAFESLESRIAWMDALKREDARQQRYRHAASIVVFEARTLAEPGAAGDWLSRVAGPIAHTIRRTARATDRVTRASETRFMVLLPETSETDAAHYAERVLADCGIWLNAMHAPVGVRASASAASATSDNSLEEALTRAIDALAGGRPRSVVPDDEAIDWEASRSPRN